MSESFERFVCFVFEDHSDVAAVGATSGFYIKYTDPRAVPLASIYAPARLFEFHKPKYSDEQSPRLDAVMRPIHRLVEIIVASKRESFIDDTMTEVEDVKFHY